MEMRRWKRTSPQLDLDSNEIIEADEETLPCAKKDWETKIVRRQSYKQESTSLCVLEWLNKITSDPEETSVTIHGVDQESKK